MRLNVFSSPHSSEGSLTRFLEGFSMTMQRYRLRITSETRTAADPDWTLCHDGGCESDRLRSIVKVLEATALSIESGYITLDNEEEE